MASRSAAAAIGPVTRWLPGAAAGPATPSPWHIRLLDDDHAASLVAISMFGSAIVIERTGPARRRSHQKSEMADADRPPEGGCHATARNPATGGCDTDLEASAARHMRGTSSLMGCLAVGFLASPQSAQEPDHLPGRGCDAVDMVLLPSGIPRAAAAAA
jgi:hypothetical protein